MKGEVRVNSIKAGLTALQFFLKLSWVSVLEIQMKLFTIQRNLTIPQLRSHKMSNTWLSAELDTKQILCLFFTLASTLNISAGSGSGFLIGSFFLSTPTGDNMLLEREITRSKGRSCERAQGSSCKQ